MTHYHVCKETSIGDPDSYRVDSVLDAARALHDEAARASDDAEETAHIEADSGEFERAWREHELSEELSALAANLDVDRISQAPLYATGTEVRGDREDGWGSLHETMRKRVLEGEVVYRHDWRDPIWHVVECDSPDCPSVEDEDAMWD